MSEELPDPVYACESETVTISAAEYASLLDRQLYYIETSLRNARDLSHNLLELENKYRVMGKKNWVEKIAEVRSEVPKMGDLAHQLPYCKSTFLRCVTGIAVERNNEPAENIDFDGHINKIRESGDMFTISKEALNMRLLDELAFLKRAILKKAPDAIAILNAVRAVFEHLGMGDDFRDLYNDEMAAGYWRSSTHGQTSGGISSDRQGREV